jgi:hypothetical protein
MPVFGPKSVGVRDLLSTFSNCGYLDSYNSARAPDHGRVSLRPPRLQSPRASRQVDQGRGCCFDQVGNDRT